MAAFLTLTTNPQTLTTPITFTGTAVYGPPGTAWAVTNQTSIAGTGPDTPPSKGIGIELASGGTVTNQVGASFVGFDYGVKILAAAGTVANSGAITGTQSDGVNLAGGSVSNAAGATISGGVSGSGVGSAIYDSGNLTVTNLGTLSGPGFSGVFVQNGIGIVTNGASSATTATISGNLDGVTVGSGSGAGTVTNFGTISAGGSVGDFGVHEKSGGSVTNGASGSTAALITGNVGVQIDSVGTVTNFATIAGTANDGVNLTQGGSVSNAAGATISGGGGGSAIDDVGNLTVTNLGTLSSPSYIGVFVKNGIGVVTNGASSATTATISGNLDGVTVGLGGGAGTVTNFGTISAGGSVGDFGVREKSGGSVTNGASGSTAALITGDVGVQIDSVGTVTNFATITGTGGTALNFTSAGANRLIDEPGAQFLGTVNGGGGASTLELAGTAPGTVNGIGTTFANFQTVELDSGASWTSGVVAAIGGNTLQLDGPGSAFTDTSGLTLASGGKITGQGKVTGGITGPGTVLASGGTLELATAISASDSTAFQIANSAGSALLLDAAPGSGNTFSFLGANGDLALANDSGFTDTISGLNVGSSGVKTNFVDIKGHAVTIAGISGQGSISGAISLSDGAVLHLTNLNSALWVANTVADGNGGTDVFVSAAPPNPPPPAGATADMILRQTTGSYEVYDIGNNAILSAGPLGQVGADFQFQGLGNFSGSDTTDMILRSSSTGAFEVYDINNNNITGAASLGAVGSNFQLAGFGKFNGSGATTDMMLRDSNSGAFELYNIGNNAITGASNLGAVGLDFQVVGFGDFNGDGTTDMMLRSKTTGSFQDYDIKNGQIAGSHNLGAVGLDFQVAGFGDFNGDGTTDMMLRNTSSGVFELYNIKNDLITSASSLGAVGLDFQVAGFGPFNGADPADMMLRNINSGAFEAYDIASNHITGAASLGTVGLDFGLGGFAAIHG